MGIYCVPPHDACKLKIRQAIGVDTSLNLVFIIWLTYKFASPDTEKPKQYLPLLVEDSNIKASITSKISESSSDTSERDIEYAADLYRSKESNFKIKSSNMMSQTDPTKDESQLAVPSSFDKTENLTTS